MVLEGDVWLDETFIRVWNPDIQVKDDGKEYRGLSATSCASALPAIQGSIASSLWKGMEDTSGKRTIGAALWSPLTSLVPG